MEDHFKLDAVDRNTGARAGGLDTRHGRVKTPVFMPVGTQATVKAMTPAQLSEIGSEIILGNTYHLNLRPSSGLIQEMGGIHSFMGWDRAVLTDSGGFQAFSLSKLRKITDAGIAFRSHLNGDKCFLGPHEVMKIQRELGTDIAMVIDECPPYPCEKEACQRAVDRTLAWAGHCRDIAADSGFLEAGHHVFGIVQGSTYSDLRRFCAEGLRALDFPGYAIGGVSVGEPEEALLEQVASTEPFLPQDKPRYVMGVGTPPQLLKMVAMGIDMFDCVMPSRAARHGAAYTPWGRINLRNNCFKKDNRPLVPGSSNYTCSHFSRAYLRHLIVAEEILGATLLTLHNLHFYLDLMRQARARIVDQTFSQWHLDWISRYESGEEGE